MENSQPKSTQALTLRQAAGEAGVSLSTIRNRINEGDSLQTFRVGRSVRILRKDFDQWLESLVKKNGGSQIKLNKSEVRKIAKNVCDYDKSRDRDDDALTQYMEKVCKRFMFIESKGAWDNEARKFVTTAFFKDMLRPMGYLSTIVPAGNNGFKERFFLVSEYWLADSKGQQRFLNISFDSSDKNPRHLNLAASLPYTPIKGNVLPLLKLTSVACSGEKASINLYLDYVAYALQNRGKHSLFSLLFYSIHHGIGKGLLINACGSLFGDGYRRVSNAQSASSFKAWQLGATFVFFDEVMNSPSKSQRADMNAFITEPVLSVNQKFQPEIDVKNMMNCIFATNEADAWSIDKYDRRRGVIANTKPPKPPEFYERFVKWWGKLENKEAAMWFFLKVSAKLTTYLLYYAAY